MARPNHYISESNSKHDALVWEAKAKATQSEIASWIGVTPQTVCNWNKRGWDLTYKQAIIIRKHLDEMEE